MKTLMNLSTTMTEFGIEKAIELHKKAGFDAYDFSFFPLVVIDWDKKAASPVKGHPLFADNYVEYAKKIRKYADELGIECRSSHAVFPTDVADLRSYIKWCLEVTSILGGKICVVHPGNNASAEENAVFYKEFLPIAKEYGVKIACENMWNWNWEMAKLDKAYDHAVPAACSHHDDFLKHLELVDDEYLVACLDIGHAEMKGLNTSSVEMIKTLGDKIAMLHIHDNDKWHDNHAAPFTMDIDFVAICKALKDIGYKGDVTLEIDTNFGKNISEDDALKILTNLANIAKKLKEMIINA